MDPEAARMLADLGNAHREFVSAPIEGGISARAAELREADTRAANEAHRDRIKKGATDPTNRQHVVLSLWNQEATFGGASMTEDLLNRYDGQGHRAALANKLSRNYDETRESQENMYGEERTMWMQGHGGSFPRNRPPPASRASRAPPPPTNTKRQRAASPRSSGVKRFAPGYARHDSAGPAPTAPQPGSIPIINPQLASAVQAAAGRAAPSSPLPVPTSASGINTNGARPPRASSVPALAPPLNSSSAATPTATSNSSTPTLAPARPASPALSVVSSSSGPAADAQARLMARFLAQKAKMTATAPPPKAEAPVITNDRMDVDPQLLAASKAPQSAEDGVPKAQDMIKASLAAQQQKNSTITPARRAAVNGTASSATPMRQRITGAVANVSGIHKVPGLPLGVGSSAANRATANGIQTQTTGQRPRLTNGGATSASSSSSSQRHPSVHDVHARAQASSLQPREEDRVKAMVFAAKRTPEELEEIEEHYRKNPHRSLLDKARQKLAGEVVKLAADGDEAAAQAYLKDNKHPCRRWLVEAAIAACSGRVPVDLATHPTVREIVKATKHESATSVSESIAGIATETTGILTAAYYSVTGRFLGNKEYRLPAVPLTAHVSLTSKVADFDPLTLADAMDALANYVIEKGTA